MREADQTLLARLRQRFAEAGTGFEWTPEWPVAKTTMSAGVLLPLQASANGLQLLLTRRTGHLHHHPGQISLPGGRVEPGDGSPQAAALRESEEEIGLAAHQVEVLGSLPEYATSSGFRVTPVVGLLGPDFEARLDDFEVAELFTVPLGFVLDPHNHQHHRVERPEGIRHFYAIPCQGRFIWGATAGMLAMLSAFLLSKRE